MSNYRRGYLVELRALRELEGMGYSTFRSAKSGGPFDIGGTKETEILLVQAKREKEPSGDPTAKYSEDIRRLRELPTPSCARKELWIWMDRKGWRKIEVRS
jgi:Holliday junction resolvase